MAPPKSMKKDASNKRAQGLADLASRALQQLHDRFTISSNSIAELNAAVTQPFPKFSISADEARGIEAIGSRLWNAATNVLREHAGNDAAQQTWSKDRFIASLRAFAFLLIEKAHCSIGANKKDVSEQTRIFKLAIKASRFCLEKDALDYASTVLERCSEYANSAEDPAPLQLGSHTEPTHEGDVLSRLVAEYYMLRISHAWKSCRLDTAEHFFRKISKHTLAKSAVSAEYCAELCLEIGKALSKQRHLDVAVSWLDRGNGVLDSCSESSLSAGTEDLRLTIVDAVVDALCKQNNPTAYQRAHCLVDMLKNEHGLGKRTAVLAIELKLALQALPPALDTLSSILGRMIQSTILTDRTFRMMMHSIHKVKRVDHDIALNALQRLICGRLVQDLGTAMEPEQVKDWLEKATVTYTMFVTSQQGTETSDMGTTLLTVFNMITQASSEALSPKATHALQTLIWKASSSSESKWSGPWLELLRHQLFDSAGMINKARIGRKAIMVALECKDLEAARRAYFQMPEVARNEDMSRYLAFKLALRSNDDGLASESLNMLLKHSERDPKYLFACALEAQQFDNRAIAVAAFQAVLQRNPKGAHLPTLLRCTARLLIPELNTQSGHVAESTIELVRVFETAAANTRLLRQGSEDHWRTEIQWWSKNAYNLALKFCAGMEPEHLIRLLRACLKFLDCYPDNGGLMHHDDLLRRKQLCRFLVTSALIVLGRSTDDKAALLQHYAEARREISFFMQCQQQLACDTSAVVHDQARVLEILKFDLESTFKLQQWDQLDAVLNACLEFDGCDRWDAMADLVIIIHTETRKLSIDSSATAKIPDLLQKIINESWKKDKDVVKLARWLRVSFSIDLSDADGDLSLKLLGQATMMAKRRIEGHGLQLYPEDELQWMAITAYNRAVDYLAQDEFNKVHEWMEATLGLAKYAADNGILHASLTDKKKEMEAKMSQ